MFINRILSICSTLADTDYSQKIHIASQSVQSFSHRISFTVCKVPQWLLCCLNVLSERVTEWECVVTVKCGSEVLYTRFTV